MNTKASGTPSPADRRGGKIKRLTTLLLQGYSMEYLFMYQSFLSLSNDSSVLFYDMGLFPTIFVILLKYLFRPKDP